MAVAEKRIKRMSLPSAHSKPQIPRPGSRRWSSSSINKLLEDDDALLSAFDLGSDSDHTSTDVSSKREIRERMLKTALGRRYSD